ncbi:MAG TPA: CRISPR-associated protein Cas4 [Methanomassiliicoccales archaeon]|nr:CRISPR-associated protein Cas4 [Methanomassiliicoccales archaeon]
MGLQSISASELERFSYCPLSWWLGRQEEFTSEALENGEARHGEVAKGLNEIVSTERSARDWEMLVLVFSVVATALAIVGVSLMIPMDSTTVSYILGAIAIIWIGAAAFLLFRSLRIEERRRTTRYEQGVAIAAIVGMVVALNAVSLLQDNFTLGVVVEVIALLWLIGASFALNRSLKFAKVADNKRKEQAVEGTILYVDGENSRLLRSEKYGLTGRPDYILEVGDELVPVELKTGRKPRGPLFSHVIQVSAYCMLVEDAMNRKVSHGILRYGDVEHEIDLDDDMRDLVIGKLAEMREESRTGDVHRNHQREGKCRSCSRRDKCPERLA